MATVRYDLVSGATGEKSKRGWERATRVALVDGLTGTGTAKLTEAVAAVETTYPIGSEHPAFENCYLDTITVKAEAPGAFELNLNYTYRDTYDANSLVGGTGAAAAASEYTLEVGASITQISTYYDYTSQPITVAYTSSGVSTTQGVAVTASRPQATLTISRVENSNPLNKAKEYVGTTNNTATWVLDSTALPGQWLCTAIMGRTQDRENYSVTYSFDYAKDGHNPMAYWTDHDGRPPADLVWNEGIKRAFVQPYKDFNDLDLG